MIGNKIADKITSLGKTKSKEKKKRKTRNIHTTRKKTANYWWLEMIDSWADDRYKPNKQIGFKTSMLISDLRDYSESYIVVKGDITVTNPGSIMYDKKLALKNNALFTSCISKINSTLIDNTKDLNIVMLMYNLSEYSKNYRKTTGSFWNYYRDEPNSGLGGNNNNVNYSIKDS